MLDATPPCRLDHAQQDVGTAGTRAPTPSGRRQGWCVASTYPKRETQTEAGFTTKGFEPYLPLCLVRGRLLPLFPAYLFVWLDLDAPWHGALHVPGLYDLIRDPATTLPHMTRAGEIQALQTTEALRRIPQPPESLWRPGASVRLAGGGLNGHAGVVTEVGKHNALVAMMLFGHLRSVSVPIDSLRARDSD